MSKKQVKSRLNNLNYLLLKLKGCMSSFSYSELQEYLRKSRIEGTIYVLIGLFGFFYILYGCIINKKYLTFFNILSGVIPLILYFSTVAFYGLREIITAPKRYSQLDWVLKSIAPIELQALLHYKGARKLRYYAELRLLTDNLNSPPLHKIALISPTWNASSIINQPIQAQVYFHPNYKFGGVIIIQNMFLVWLPGSIASDF